MATNNLKKQTGMTIFALPRSINRINMNLTRYKTTTQIFFTLLFTLTAGLSRAQITVTNNAPYNSAAYLVQNVLLGSGVTASNFTYNGIPIAMGFFNGANTNLGLDSGIIMTSGDCHLAVGPNNNSSAALVSNLPGDADLDAIMSPTTSYDACILEFDFVPMADTIQFRYVFGSDEYMEWVSSFPGGINDGFGFFLSGPGISGPYSNNSANIALIPNTSLPVTMFNLNLNSNGQYYFDNGDGNGTGTAPDGPDVQYDGFTHPLTAKHWVQCGQTYHIKIAIGDGGDWWIDSGVFLEAGSFASGGVVVGTSSSGANINGNDSTVYEGCGSLVVYFNRGNDTLTQDTITYSFGGTATPGADFNSISNQVIFPVGVDSVGITITPTQDNLSEGTETVYIILAQGGPCNSQTADTITIYIENVDLPILTVNHPSICPGDSAVMTATATGGMPGYTYTWSNNLGSGTSATVTATTSATYTVTVTDTCGNTVNQVVPVTVTSPTAAFTQHNATANTIDFTNASSSNVVTWSWDFGDGNQGSGPSPSHTYPSVGATYTVVLCVTDASGCTACVSDVVTIYPDFYFWAPNAFTPNGDLINNVYSGVGVGIGKYQMLIFDRWGELLFKSEDITKGWDGTCNGKLVEEGVYIVVFDVVAESGEKVHKVTHVSVIR
jgi:gliding motility-associated-like protein